MAIDVSTRVLKPLLHAFLADFLGGVEVVCITMMKTNIQETKTYAVLGLPKFSVRPFQIL
jgi:hypothetical protein